MAESTAPEPVPLEKRAAEAERMLARYPDRVPIVCVTDPRSNLPDIGQQKFLVPGMMLCGELKYLIHKRINANLAANHTLYLFVNGTSPKSGVLMSEVYNQCKADDGFLYVTYCAEITLGRLPCIASSAGCAGVTGVWPVPGR